jgi:hypothetical protein
MLFAHRRLINEPQKNQGFSRPLPWHMPEKERKNKEALIE